MGRLNKIIISLLLGLSLGISQTQSKYETPKMGDLSTILVPYRPIYMIPAYHSFSKMEEPYQNNEIKFQFSLKVNAIKDIFFKDLSLMLAYTQVSWWQYYNESQSSAFRTNDYSPEAFLEKIFEENKYNIYMLRFGYKHTSNGENLEKSRTLNKVYLSPTFKFEDLFLTLDFWTYVGTNSKGFLHDNPDIDDYRGYGNVNLTYFFENKAFIGLTLSNPYSIFYRDGFKGNMLLECSYPLVRNIAIYGQYFYGYGDSMYEYRDKSNRIGIGFSINRP